MLYRAGAIIDNGKPASVDEDDEEAVAAVADAPKIDSPPHNWVLLSPNTLRQLKVKDGATVILEMSLEMESKCCYSSSILQSHNMSHNMSVYVSV